MTLARNEGLCVRSLLQFALNEQRGGRVGLIFDRLPDPPLTQLALTNSEARVITTFPGFFNSPDIPQK